MSLMPPVSVAVAHSDTRERAGQMKAEWKLQHVDAACYQERGEAE